jgi:hypothetical protein
MTKISQYPDDASPQTTDYAIGNQASGPTTQRFKFSNLITLFFNNIPTNKITAASLATNAITLGYAQNTSGFATQSTSVISTGLGVAVTIPAGGRDVEVEVFVPQATMTSINTLGFISIWQNASIVTANGAAAGTQLQEWAINIAQASDGPGAICRAHIVAPVAGATCFYLAYVSNSGPTTLALNAGATFPISITAKVV